MAVPVAELRAHVHYSAWASARLVGVAESLTLEELTHDHGTADKSILATLVHVFAADRLWLSRVEHAPRAAFVDPVTDMKLTVLQDEWPAVLRGWDSYLAMQSDESVREPIDYKSLAGDPYQTPLWQIVLHVVNHGTHHRGQVSGFLRKGGRVPPPLDLIAYYRERASP